MQTFLCKNKILYNGDKFFFAFVLNFFLESTALYTMSMRTQNLFQIETIPKYQKIYIFFSIPCEHEVLLFFEQGFCPALNWAALVLVLHRTTNSATVHQRIFLHNWILHQVSCILPPRSILSMLISCHGWMCSTGLPTEPSRFNHVPASSCRSSLFGSILA